MIRNFALVAALVSVAAHAENSNKVQFERSFTTPTSHEIRGMKVDVYRMEGTVRQDPRCGGTYVGGGMIWNTCYVEDPVFDREETLDLRVNFPEGSDLAQGDVERYKIEFTNDYRHPENDYGTVEISIKSKKNRYNRDSLKDIQVHYGTMNDLNPRLR